MVVSCEHVWRELSNYLEDDVDPALKVAIEEHIKGCKNCMAVLEGTRNIVNIYGDERLLEVPQGFGQRLHRRLEENMPASRGGIFGWVLAFAAVLLMAGGVKLGQSSGFYNPELRSQHADPAQRSIPADMLVVVVDGGKVFHRGRSCPFIVGSAHLRSLSAKEAIRQGYAPCVRCMREYLAKAPPRESHEDEQEAYAEVP